MEVSHVIAEGLLPLYLLDTARVQSGLVNVRGGHLEGIVGVEIVLLLIKRFGFKYKSRKDGSR